MYTDQRTHASLSDSVLSEKPFSPPAEGNRQLSKGQLDYDISSPVTNDEVSTAEALRAVTAILTRQVDACAALDLLPSGYYGEDCDFEEFFTPEAALQTALSSPEWGCIDDTKGEPLERHLVQAVEAVVTELKRAFDHSLPLSARLRFRLMKACRAELTLLHAELHAAMRKAVA